MMILKIERINFEEHVKKLNKKNNNRFYFN